MNPIRQMNYTTEQISKLDLLDSPFLMVYISGIGWIPIQTGHLTAEQEVEAFADIEWKYMRTTHEWIPLFYAVDSEHILKNLVSIVKEEDGTYLLSPINYPFYQE